MKILKSKAGKFKVESRKKGEYYIVDPVKGSCTCPRYRFRMAKINGLCKRLIAIKEKAPKELKKRNYKSSRIITQPAFV